METQETKVISLKKGEVVFWQGDQEKVLYKILSGSIAIYSNYGESQEIRLSLLQKDQCFGEMSILEERPRSATAVAEEDVLLELYPECLMVSFIHQNPNFALELMQNLSRQLRNSTRELEKMYNMLFQLSKRKVVSHEIQKYIEMHTTYDSDGTARFNLKM